MNKHRNIHSSLFKITVFFSGEMPSTVLFMGVCSDYQLGYRFATYTYGYAFALAF